jgi:protein phosphatase
MHRSGNEDSFLVADLTTGDDAPNDGAGPQQVGERGSLLIVSDGMGGAAAGEIASELAVKTIRESLMEQPFGVDVSDHLRRATEKANEKIWSLSQENTELTGMGATVTAALVHGTIAYIAQVGDSRAYLIRGGQTRQVTKDQSLAQMLVDAGAIQPEQVASVPQNVIMQALGTQPNVRVAMTTLQLYRDDHLVLCSDGLSNKIDPQEMREIIEDAQDLAGASQEMIEIANERGGEDNITVILARFDGEALPNMGDGATDHISTHRQINPPQEPEADSGIEDEEPTLSMPPASRQDGAAAASAPSPETAAADQDLSDEQPTTPDVGKTLDKTSGEAADWPYETQRRLRKKSYSQVLIIAAVSLMLIAAAAYFFYTYLMQPSPPAPAQEAPAQQETPPQSQPAPPQQ